MKSKTDLIEYYDMLIEENNDPFRDPQPLRDYMDKWDGKVFLDSMCLSRNESVLEIGVGTGRIAAKVLPECKLFVGIDISQKTINRANENLVEFSNAHLICADFLKYNFDTTFDVIYSSLTLMHFENKQEFINKVASLMNSNGKFILSIDKNQDSYIDIGTRKLLIYPDTPDNITLCIMDAKLKIVKRYETQFAHIFVCAK
ncbi:MAG: class I SAM-dependent methyltransferase [Clostridia bacterium]|nr:class I SAM-dependent methyltransferase [Clostridia bacterium]